VIDSEEDTTSKYPYIYEMYPITWTLTKKPIWTGYPRIPLPDRESSARIMENPRGEIEFHKSNAELFS